MKTLASYLLAITVASMLCAIVGVFLREGTASRVARFCVGLLVILCVAVPLSKLDLREIVELLDRQYATRDFDAEAYEERAAALLRAQVKESTERLILSQAQSLGAQLEISVTVSTEEFPQPLTVELIGAATPQQQTLLCDFLRDTLDIPPSRQKWRISE